MLNELHGKVIWVTGASGGLAPGVCKKIYDATGAAFALHGHTHHERVNQLALELEQQGARTIAITSDLTIDGEAKQTLKEIINRLGVPYALVHMAGPYVRKPVAEHTRAEFDANVVGNLTTFWEAARAVLPYLRKREDGGRIIGFGMSGAQHTTPMLEHGPHLAAKAGINALAKTMALEEVGHGVTVNVINPGHIVHKNIDRKTARAKKAGPDHPMGVHGSYEDITDALLYLLSPAASYVTGATLDVSGGWRHP